MHFLVGNLWVGLGAGFGSGFKTGVDSGFGSGAGSGGVWAQLQDRRCIMLPHV